MKYNIIKQNGFRALSSEEITAVSGGDGEEDEGPPIIVSAKRSRPAINTGFIQFDNYGGGGAIENSPEFQQLLDGDFGSLLLNLSEGNTLTSQDEAVLESIFSGLVDGIERLIQQGGDFPLELPDGTIVSAVDFVKTFGTALTAIEIGNLAINALQGEASAADAAKLLLSIGFAATIPATAGPLAVFVASAAAGVAADLLVDQFIANAAAARETSLFDGTTNDPDKSADFNIMQNLFDLFGGPSEPGFQ